MVLDSIFLGKIKFDFVVGFTFVNLMPETCFLLLYYIALGLVFAASFYVILDLYLPFAPIAFRLSFDFASDCAFFNWFVLFHFFLDNLLSANGIYVMGNLGLRAFTSANGDVL